MISLVLNLQVNYRRLYNDVNIICQPSPNRAYLGSVLRTFAQIQPYGWTSDTLGPLCDKYFLSTLQAKFQLISSLPVGRHGRRAGPPACGQECNHQWLLGIISSVFWGRPEYASYFPLIIFSCQNDINILLFFKGFHII